MYYPRHVCAAQFQPHPTCRGSHSTRHLDGAAQVPPASRACCDRSFFIKYIRKKGVCSPGIWYTDTSAALSLTIFSGSLYCRNKGSPAKSIRISKPRLPSCTRLGKIGAPVTPPGVQAIRFPYTRRQTKIHCIRASYTPLGKLTAWPSQERANIQHTQPPAQPVSKPPSRSARDLAS